MESKGTLKEAVCSLISEVGSFWREGDTHTGACFIRGGGCDCCHCGFSLFLGSPVGTTEELEAVLLPLQHRYRSWNVLEGDDFSVTKARKTNLSSVAPITAPEHNLFQRSNHGDDYGFFAGGLLWVV